VSHQLSQLLPEIPRRCAPLTPEFNMTLRTVVLYGNSLVVSSIGASLQGRADLQVSSVDATRPQAEERLRTLQPDVVIFDLAAARPEFAIDLWQAQPHLLLIGVDLLTHRALMLSGQPSRLLTLDDLLEVMKDEERKRE
jgi:hypothetical protein